jgi:hypothetical protein
MLATLMRGALADALEDPPAAPLGAAPGDEEAPLLLAIVPVTCTRLST